MVHFPAFSYGIMNEVISMIGDLYVKNNVDNQVREGEDK